MDIKTTFKVTNKYWDLQQKSENIILNIIMTWIINILGLIKQM